MTARALSIAAMLTLTTLTGGARASNETAAEELFSKGVELFRTKKFQESGTAFDEACKLAARGATAYNAARAWKSAGADARAADDYALALRLGDLSDAFKKDATEQLRVLEPKLVLIELSGPEGARARLEGGREQVVPIVIHAAPGTVKVTFLAGSRQDTQSLDLAPGQRGKLAMRDSSGTPSTPTPTSGGAPSSKADAASNSPSSKTNGIVAMSVGGALLVTGIYLGVDGMSVRDRFVAQGRSSTNLHDRAESQRLWANVTGAIGLAGLAVGAYFVFFRSPEPRPRTTSLASTRMALGVGPGGLVVQGLLP